MPPSPRRPVFDVNVAAWLAGLPAERLLAHMGKDKKVRDGQITLILPRQIGDTFIMKDAPVGELRDFLGRAA